MFRKVFVVGIIILFVGASVAVPNIKMLTGVESAFYARAEEISDGAPDDPSQPSGNTSGYICIDYNYSTSTTDPNELNVSYGWDWDGDLIVDEWTDWYESNETCTIAHNWSEPGGYNISVKANNTLGNMSNWSAPLNITMQNHPPNEPSNPSPPDGATDVDIEEGLSWTGGDPDSCDTVTYDVYFGTNSSSLPMVSNNQSATTYDPGIMNYNTTYYWQIVTWDNHNASTASLIWNFTTTANHPPNEPSDPDPEDGATDVDIDADLSWTGGDPDPGDTITYDVYFGTTSPPPKVAGSQTATSYDPGTLDYSTTYYWQIVSWDSQGASTEGQIWHFTTKALLPPEITITKPEKGSFYLRNELLFPLLINTIVYGPIDITANATSDAGIEKVEFYINEKLKDTVTEEPYTYRWAPLLCSRYTIKVTAYDNAGQNVSDEIKVFKWRVHPVLLLAGTLFISKQLLRSLRTKTPFQWTILRGTVFNLKQVGDKYHGRAIRLHYTEIAPFSSVSGTGFIKLRKITFARVPFMLTYDIGPVGLTTYIFGIFPGKINRILA